MEITKRLFLNKTPKNVPNGALTCAKNIVIDDTGSFITNEPGFSVAFECPNDGEFIVGVIPCNNEIVIFTFNSIDKTSHIYRLNDNKEIKEVIPHNWNYNGGTICGTFTYNYKNELIIALSEYDAYKFVNGIKTLNSIPLKSWNLDDSNNISTYNIEDDIPKFKCNYTINNDGALLCGVYTYFIRFSVDKHNYTKWFQITDDIIIYNIYEKERPIHKYMLNDTEVTLKFKEQGSEGIINEDDLPFDNFEINKNDISTLGILLKLNDINCDKYQIGYILKRDSETVGRILNTYDSTVQSINIINNNYFEEISIDDLLENPHQFYNVRNLINYNNRLYIANYQEYENIDLAKQIKTENGSLKIYPKIKTYSGYLPKVSSETISFANLQLSITEHVTYNSSNISYYIEDGKYYLNNPATFIKNNIANQFTILFNNGNNPINIPITESKRTNVGNGNGAQDVNWLIDDFILMICGKGNTSNDYFGIYASNGRINNNSFKIRLDFDNNQLVFEGAGKSIAINSDENSPTAYFNVLIERRKYNKYNTQLGTVAYSWAFHQNNDDAMFTPSYNKPRGGVNGTSYCSKNDKTITSNYIIPNNSNRTFIPLQKYNIYVHFIRKDGSCTNGYFLRSLQLDKEQYHPSLTPMGLLNTYIDGGFIPEGYIGYFLSYEDIEVNATPVLIYRSKGTEAPYTLCFTNTSFIYNDQNIIGNVLNYYNSKAYNIKMDSVDNINKTTIEKHKEFISPESTGYVGAAIVSTDNEDNIYKKKNKTLYRLTPNIYTTNEYEDDNFRFHPSYISVEKIIYFDKNVIMNPTSSSVLDESGAVTTYRIGLGKNKNNELGAKEWNYSLEPLNCYSLLQDYNKGAVSLNKSDGTTIGVVYNSIIQPDRLSDLLEIKAAYTSKPSKTYTNYSEDNIDTFNKTIYRSDVISDESLINSFRNFRVDNYKNIFENKGKITNLVGIGLYFLVHTEYSLFVFDRSNRLNAKAQLEIPDTFDVDYQEVLPSNEGFGGLIDKEESIITKNGYIWLDKTNKYIFIYVDGKINILSNDINNLLESINIKTVRFAEDIERNRLLICIYDINNNTITISYNFNTNTFISLHDYSFTNNYKTYNISYLFNMYKDRKRLYVFNNNSNTFGNLFVNNDIYYPQYK